MLYCSYTVEYAMHTKTIFHTDVQLLLITVLKVKPTVCDSDHVEDLTVHVEPHVSWAALPFSLLNWKQALTRYQRGNLQGSDGSMP